MARERGRGAQPGRDAKRPSRAVDQRYGNGNVSAKVLGTLVALGLIVFGAVWTLQGGSATLGPIVAALGVALGYVVLIQRRR